jgi:HD-GYP domain-containing protein (c-di-GMP phosphodiesterase class II)
MARNIILKDSGTHFDPDVVDAFLAVESQFIEIRNALFEDDRHECGPFMQSIAAGQK